MTPVRAAHHGLRLDGAIEHFSALLDACRRQYGPEHAFSTGAAENLRAAKERAATR